MSKGTTKTTSEGLVLNGLIEILVHETPSLEKLGRDELQTVAKAVVFGSRKEDLKRRVDLERINYPAKRALFLSRSEKKSQKTESSYRKAIDLLDAWAERVGISVLDMKASHADAFIDSLEGSPSTIRLRVAAVSSFFTFLERETDGRVRNPFRGTKARPAKKSKAPVVPSDSEIASIAEHLSPVNRAAVRVMQELGLGVGALQSLSIWNGRYTAFSKGKEISGAFSNTASKAIRQAGLDGKKPFADLPEDSVRNAFKYAAKKMYAKEGSLAAPYSVHDIRHCYAIWEYRKDKDIYRLKVLLNHASIQVTENYLRGLPL